MRSHRQGQLVSLDLVLSMAAFFLVCLFLFSLWNLYLNRLQENMQTEEVELLAFQISNMLMGSPGVPFNWEKNPAMVQTPGLAVERGIVDADKIDAFFNISYNETKRLWNIERYEFQFKMLNEQGTLMQSRGPELNHSTVIALSRWALVDGQAYQFMFALGEREP